MVDGSELCICINNYGIFGHDVVNYAPGGLWPRTNETYVYGAGICEQVCPRNCYEMDKNKHTALMPGADRCVQCGACIVKCPFDALYFESPRRKIIYPDVIRKFKLNLLGKRLVKRGNKK
ncbi:MAG: 4Fe-4S binding protein [bacterium]|nr:4Fe-4S binding protein [bacterium]